MSAIVVVLNSLSTAWAGLMLAAAWQSTILALVVAAVTWRWERSTPAMRYWLWQIVAFKLLILPVWTATIPIPGFVSRSLSDRPLALLSAERSPAEPGQSFLSIRRQPR